MYQILLSESSVDGHLHCFRILSVENSAAMDFGVYASFRISVLIFFFLVYN